MPDKSLIDQLNTSDPAERARVILRTRARRDRDAVPHLLPLLNDPDSGIRWAVVYALEVLGDKSVLPLVRPLVNDPSKHVRGVVVRVLGRYGTPDDIDAIRAALRDPEPYVRFCALRALEPHAEPAVLPDIQAMLDDDARVWESAGERVSDTAKRTLLTISRQIQQNRAALNQLGALEFPESAEYADTLADEPADDVPPPAPSKPPQFSPVPAPPPTPQETDLSAVENPLEAGVDPMDWLESLAAEQGNGELVDTSGYNEELESLDAEEPDRDATPKPGQSPPGVLRGLRTTHKGRVIRRLIEKIRPKSDDEPPEDEPQRKRQSEDVGSAPEVEEAHKDLFVDEPAEPEPDEAFDWFNSADTPPAGDGTLFEAALSDNVVFGDMQEGGITRGEETTPPQESAEVSEVQFSGYYPQKAEVGGQYGVYVYVHRAEDAPDVEQDVSRFEKELGDTVGSPRKARQTANLKVGTKVTVVPESDDLTFEPASLTKTWRGTYTRFGFDFVPGPETAHTTAFVRVSIQVANIEIAHIQLAVDIEPKRVPVSNLSDNPLIGQKYQSETVTPYQTIFISYSREDSEVARAYKLAQTALGNEVFFDVDSLRAGENWQAGLARAIDRADVFQLFWSMHSASSKYCRYEWDYAMRVRCPDTRCETFIRPVYWEQPPAPIPDQLRHLNFRYVPFEDADE